MSLSCGGAYRGQRAKVAQLEVSELLPETGKMLYWSQLDKKIVGKAEIFSLS